MRLNKKQINFLKKPGRGKALMDILNKIRIENNILAWTDLETTFQIKLDKNIPDGMYEVLASQFVKTESRVTDYPEIPSYKDSGIEKELEFNIEQLENVSRVLVKKHFTHNAVRCIYFNKNEMIGTDFHQLAIEKIKSNLDEIIINPEMILKIFKVFKIDKFKTYLDKYNIYFVCDDIVISSRLFDERFPDHKRVLPDSKINIPVLDMEKLKNSNFVKIIPKVDKIILASHDKKLVIYGLDKEREIYYKLETDIKYTLKTIPINYHIFCNALSYGKKLWMQDTKTMDQMIFNKDFQFCFMPILDDENETPPRSVFIGKLEPEIKKQKSNLKIENEKLKAEITKLKNELNELKK